MKDKDKYICLIHSRYAVKNKLQKACIDFLDKFERRIIDASNIQVFVKGLLTGLNGLMQRFPRCTPFVADASWDHVDGDIYLTFGGQQIMNFVLTKGKETV